MKKLSFFILASLVFILAGTSVASAALTFNGNAITGDTNSAVDASGNITIGGTSATGITIGRAGLITSFSDPIIVSGNETTTNLSITGLASAGNPCLVIGTGGAVATSTCVVSFTASGDLSGNNTSQTVVGIQGRTVSSTAPSANQVLAWNGTTWTPATIVTGSGTVTTSSAVTANNFVFWGNGTNGLAGTSTLSLSGTTVTQSNALNIGGTVNVTGTATFASGLTQSGGTVSLASTTITGNATTTNLSITSLAGASGCLSVSGTGVVTTSTCSGGTLSGGQVNYIPLWTGASTIATSTLQASSTSIVTTGGFAIGTTTNQAAGSLLVTGNATTTNLSITGLAGASGCLSVSGTGVVTTSTCSGVGGSGTVTTSSAVTANNFVFWGNGTNGLAGTSTLSLSGTTVTQSNALNIGGTVNVTGTATFASGLTQSGGTVSLASTTITGNATTTNLSITSLAGASGCLSVSGTGVVTTSTCSGGTLSGGQVNYIPLWTGASTIATSTLQASSTSIVTTGGFAIGTTTNQAAGSLLVTGNATTTNLTISGLGSAGNPCLIVGAAGVVATSTCGTGGGIAATGGPSQYQTAAFSSSSTITGVSAGATGQVLTSNGASAYPTFQNVPGITLNGLLNPTGNVSYAMGANQIIFSGVSLTGTQDFMAINDIATDTSTGYGIDVNASSGSTLNPARFAVNGLGLVVNNNGTISTNGIANTGNATTTNLSITGLAGASGCLSVSGTGVVTTSTCSGGTLSGGQVNYIPLWTGASTIATSTLQASSTSIVTTGGFAIGTTTNQAAGSLLVTGNATTTNLSITGLAGASGCLSVSGTGVVTTSTCSGVGGSGTVTTSSAVTANNFVFWGNGTNGLAGTSTLSLSGTTVTQSNALNIGGTVNVTGTATFASGLTQSGGTVSLASTTITGNATTTNLSITSLAGASGCLSVSGTGVVTTSACSGGTLSGGQTNYVSLWTGTGTLGTSTLQATTNALVTTGGFAIGTTTNQAAGGLLVTGNATTTNLTISGLGSAGNPCLIVGAAGVVATSTCGASGGTGTVTTSSVITTNTFPFWGTAGGALSGTSTLSYQSSTGYLGVNDNTPLRALEVAGNSNVSSSLTSSAPTDIGILNTNSSTNNNYSAFSFLTYDANANEFLDAKIAGIATSHASGTVSGQLSFITRNAGTIQDDLDILPAGNANFLGPINDSSTFTQSGGVVSLASTTINGNATTTGNAYTVTHNNAVVTSTATTATTNINWALGNDQVVQLQTSTVLTYSGCYQGEYGSLDIYQDGTGSRTVTWPTTGSCEVSWLNGEGTPTLPTAANSDFLVSVEFKNTSFVTSTIVGRQMYVSSTPSMYFTQ